jgi:hypothetical protein
MSPATQRPAGFETHPAKLPATPLWRDLQGRTTYRVLGALTLDELCTGSKLKTAELVRRVRRELRRPLSRQTLPLGGAAISQSRTK